METEACTRVSSRVADGACSQGTDESSSQIDILVMGFGPAGTMMVNLLTPHGASVLAIDRASDIYITLHAIALDNEVLWVL